MNDNDLERRLRSESGPREQAYVPSQLPAKLEPRADRRPSRAIRMAVLVPAAIAGVAVVLVAGALLSGPGTPSPGVGAGSSRSASATAPILACAPLDLALSAEPWGGAAGSRGTTVSVQLADGRDPCMLSSRVNGMILNGDGAVIASGASTEPENFVRLGAGTTYAVGVAWSNWCSDHITRPVSLALGLAGSLGSDPVAIPDTGIDPVPPCMGDGGTTLSVTELQSAP